MSKGIARKAESYENEERFFAETVELLKAKGFSNVKARKDGAIKIIDTESADGGRASFWIKLGWSKVPFAAIQFGMFSGPEGSAKSNSEFVDFVKARVERMKARGITHSLLVHRDELSIAVRVDDVATIYSEQMRRFPVFARNTKSPTMWFYDPRPQSDPGLTAIVMRYAIPLDLLAGKASVKANTPEARSRIAEVEARVMQAVFRNRVGKRCAWKCVITGASIVETLDAAHLPGKDWRRNNEATDGILVRVDIHRLIDNGLAQIVNGRFKLSEKAKSEYGQFDGLAVI